MTNKEQRESGEDSPGLEQRYLVKRIRNSEKHERCQYFVLDLTHDSYAAAALTAYADACQDTHPILAADLYRMIAKAKK